MKKDLVMIIILNYKGLEDTIECIASVKKISYTNFSCVIVDNNSEDNSYEKLNNMFPEYKVIQSLENNGYASGNNLGIKYALQEGAEYVCILNNDVIVDPDFLTILIKYMKENNTVGITGPGIFEYFHPAIIQSTGATINLYKGAVPILNGGMVAEKISNDNILCDYVGGACLVIKRETLEKIDLIPECYFLFFEETEWCLKAKKNNYDVVCVPQAKIFHKGSASINKISGLSEYYFSRNQVLFEKRNASLFQFVCFSVYLMLKLMHSLLLGKLKLKKIQAIYDGFRK